MKVVSAIGLVALAIGAFACEVSECDNEETGAEGVCAKSLTRFEGPSRSGSQPYTPGATVSIDSPNGNVRVVQGSGSEVAGTFEPFVLRAFDTPEEAWNADLARLTAEVRTEAGNVVVDVDRESGSPGTLGADITVALPPDFGGILSVNQQNGSTEVDFVGAAVGVLVTSNNGSCDVATGSAGNVAVTCENGDLDASIGAVAAQTGTGFETGNGTITLALPTTGAFSVQAQAMDGGVVQTNNVPATCTVNEASPSAKTVSCNGATSADPVYQARANGTSLADVVLNF